MENGLTKSQAKSGSLAARRAAWAVLFLLFLSVLAIVVIPAWIVQPFKAQSQGGLELSYSLRRWSPVLTLAALAIVLMLIVWLWRGTRWWRKAILVVMLLMASVSTWFARQNHFEWMFNPLPNALYARASEAAFVSDTDMVLAVERNGEAVAYPVRLMAYHHVVEDVVGGTPVVATY
jgi:hypothetical protein